ncbi:MAG TPA: M48 family metalloprotease, partial [Gemmatimonadota bacterium]|nr:M48 family metalloprotease [Gemmatimonadota bacterium]
MSGRALVRRVTLLRVGAAALLLLACAAPGRAQIFDRLKEQAEQVLDTAEKVGTAVVPISTEQEVEIGRGIAATVAGHYTLSHDSTLTRYVSLVGNAVAAADPRPDVVYRFGVLDSDEVNAFAAPGGYVFVTKGALALMDDEAMLAGVLAHEVAHVNQKDIIEEIQDRARTELGIREAAERIDVTGEEYLEKAIGVGTNALFMGLGREDEIEADTIGMRMASDTGYDRTGIERFVSRLDEHSDDESLSLLVKTHPDPDDRLEALREAMRRIPSDRSGR